jgi:hypothetical protein
MSVNVHENTVHPDLLDLLRLECIKLNDYTKKRIGINQSKKYSTLWLHKDVEPETFIEYIVQQISYQDFPDGFPEGYMGMEWWAQVKETREGITFHYDKDEYLASTSNIIKYPLKSTVTYLTDTGGPTAIFKDELYNKGYLSFPKVNKHIRFDGNLFHGVMGPLGKEIPSNENQRVTLLINYWTYKPAEPNCIVLSNNEVLQPLEKEHQILQESMQKEKSKIIKMNYGKGSQELIIFRDNKRIPIKFSKSLKKGYTYSFQFVKDCVIF